MRALNSMTVADLLRRTARRYPGKTGIISSDVRHTWREVDARSNSLANALLHLGLTKGDRVAILSRNCHQYLEFYLAVAKAGLVGVPLNARLIGRELSYLLEDSGAIALLVHQEFGEVVKGIASELEQVRHYIGIGEGHPYPLDFEDLVGRHSGDEPGVAVEEDDICLISYTSGTTGRPKGAVLTHRNCVATAITLALDWRVRSDYNYLLPGAFFFAGFGQRAVPVLLGCTTTILNFEAGAVLSTIERDKIAVFSIAPTMLSMLISHPSIYKYDVSSLRHIYVTGAPLASELWKRAEAVLGPVINPAWGLTESNSTGSTLHREEVSLEGSLSRRLLSAGKAMVNIDLRVVNEEGQEVAHNSKEMGELVLRGESIMAGYWHLPQETEEVLREGWLHSGDLAVMDEEGYIYIVDRKKDVIKSGSVQIWPREVEGVLYTHPAVLHCAVIGVPDEKWGETPKALVVLKAGCEATEEEILSLCRANLASYKKPTSVEFVESLPLTSSGKVLKRELREKYWAGYERRIH